MGRLVRSAVRGERFIVRTPQGDVTFTYHPLGQRRKVAIEAPAGCLIVRDPRIHGAARDETAAATPPPPGVSP